MKSFSLRREHILMMTKQSEKTAILCIREIAHVNLLACVPVHAQAIARISGNSMVKWKKT